MARSPNPAPCDQRFAPCSDVSRSQSPYSIKTDQNGEPISRMGLDGTKWDQNFRQRPSLSVWASHVCLAVVTRRRSVGANLPQGGKTDSSGIHFFSAILLL